MPSQKWDAANVRCDFVDVTHKKYFLKGRICGQFTKEKIPSARYFWCPAAFGQIQKLGGFPPACTPAVNGANIQIAILSATASNLASKASDGKAYGGFRWSNSGSSQCFGCRCYQSFSCFAVLMNCTLLFTCLALCSLASFAVLFCSRHKCCFY